MKFAKYLLVFLMIFTSCKSKKNVISAKNVKKISTRKVIKKHFASHFDKKTAVAKFKANFQNEKQNIGLSLQIKIKKDEVIYIKGTKLITVFKAKITPKNINYYSPYFKNYFDGNFEILEKVLGTEISFNQIQNLLLGQVLFDKVSSEKQISSFKNNNYFLMPKKQNEIFDFSYTINSTNFKIKNQTISNKAKNKALTINYINYLVKENTLFPEQIVLKASKENSETKIDLKTRSVVFNSNFDVPFKIPSGYKEIKL